MNINEKSNLSFIPKDSLIEYKKIQLNTPEIIKINAQMTSKNNKYTPSYFYDKYTNQFIYINGEVIIILDTKLKIKTFSRMVINQKIKSISLEYNNKYLLYTTYNSKPTIIDLLDLYSINCFQDQKEEYIGGFFIPYRTPETEISKKEHNYFILCMIKKKSFNISRIIKSKDKYNKYHYLPQISFVSNQMKIIDFIFNHIFKILLIVEEEPFSFSLYNLKSKKCYKTAILMNNINLKKNENKLYLQHLYKQLYLINLNTSVIEVYRLNDLREIKEPIKVNYIDNNNKKIINVNNVYLQFYNDLIIVYMECCIKIFDIKSNIHEIFILNIIDKYYYNTFYQSRIFGKYIQINDGLYKIKFLKNNYKKNLNSSFKDMFFTILRRKNSNHIIKQILYELLNTCQILQFFNIVESLIINNLIMINSTFF